MPKRSSRQPPPPRAPKAAATGTVKRFIRTLERLDAARSKPDASR